MSENANVIDKIDAMIERPDRRKTTSKSNMEKARKAKIEQLKQKKLISKYSFSDSESEDSDQKPVKKVKRKTKSDVEKEVIKLNGIVAKLLEADEKKSKKKAEKANDNYTHEKNVSKPINMNDSNTPKNDDKHDTKKLTEEQLIKKIFNFN